MATRDRLSQLLDPANKALNGIDFVEIVTQDETVLRVHFLNKVPVAGTVTAATITGGERIATVTPGKIDNAKDWALDPEGRPLLTLRVPAPGDFSYYTLTLTSAKLDFFFTNARFSFKALCPSDVDCEAPPAPCPPPDGVAPPIDYLAKDFLSFRQALLDFSALRYPMWKERSEADFGVMFLEALSSLADDLSYTQDRIAAEATLDTATQRRSILRHARLVDYEPHPATSARVLLQFDVQAGPLPAGLTVAALGPDGTSIDFETGTSLVDPTSGGPNPQTFPVSPMWNHGIEPWWWDDGQRCLDPGATTMWVQGHGFAFQPGQLLLLDTAPFVTGDPPIRETVTLVSSTELTDTLFETGGQPTQVTQITWVPGLARHHDLTRTVLAGNLVPATQGRRRVETFTIGGGPVPPAAIQRTGPNATPDDLVPEYRWTLQAAPLVWLDQDGLDALPLPEILLTEQPADTFAPPVPWLWQRSLLSAGDQDAAFTVDPLRMIPIARNSDGSLSWDVDGADGTTIRFGNGVFGRLPEDGSVFRVTYRAGNGAGGNVAADSITSVDPGAASLVLAVTNPFPAAGGTDAEPDERIRRLAPQAFQALQFRAVRTRDYRNAVERLPWVQRANATFRWTGSWPTVFASADPIGTETIPIGEHIELIDLLNRYRLAGYEAYAPPPRYVTIDLIVSVCADPATFRGDVETGLTHALSTGTAPDGTPCFFNPDNFTFGTPLERSRLEAAIQDVPGVSGVVSIQVRRRDVGPDYTEMGETVAAAPNEVLRMDNDPSLPERGALKISIGGGK